MKHLKSSNALRCFKLQKPVKVSGWVNGPLRIKLIWTAHIDDIIKARSLKEIVDSLDLPHNHKCGHLMFQGQVGSPRRSLFPSKLPCTCVRIFPQFNLIFSLLNTSANHHQYRHLIVLAFVKPHLGWEWSRKWSIVKANSVIFKSINQRWWI